MSGSSRAVWMGRVLWAWGATTAIVTGVSAQVEASQSCTDCHQSSVDKGLSQPPNVLLAASSHASLDCTDCHESISMDSVDASSPKPHGEAVGAVSCGDCHEEEADIFVMHGRLEVGSNPDIPKCWSCHGAHDVLPSSDTHSRTNPTNLPGTCKACHTNTDILKKYTELRGIPLKLYETSVHGEAVLRGVPGAAVCVDCHSAKTTDGQLTAHRILSMLNPESSIYFSNIPNTCGKCHQEAAKDYWESVHGQAVKNGEMDAPVCTSCHGEHGILPISDPRSPVSAARLAEKTCAPCHESVALDERYGNSTGRLDSYVDSYHGLKRQASDVRVANCASCHGSHRILPHTDPRSSIYPANLQSTCGRCHPGISEVLAQGPIHAADEGGKTGWAEFFTVFYIWLIVITIGLMLVHNMGHWFRHCRLLSGTKHVIRLTAGETAQHWILMLSFIVLAISGFSLRFSDSWWVQILFGWNGGEGFVVRGTIHRVAAVFFMIWAIWHLLYLFTRRGRGWLRDMIVSKGDLVHIGQNALFFLGRRGAQPRFGRFSYMEKCEYWALIWGAVIMTATGLVLWFDNYFVESWGCTKGVLDVVLVIHHCEAWLATLAILVWHIYGTVFSPSVYPMNPAWLAGKMPEHMYDHEHPGDSTLEGRARVCDGDAISGDENDEADSV